MNNNINSLLEHAYNLLRDAKFDDAEKQLEKILDLDDNHADALYLQGMLKLRTGKIDDALTFLNRAISANPLKANYCNDIALVYQQTDMLENALKFFKKAIDLEPANLLFHFNSVMNMTRHLPVINMEIDWRTMIPVLTGIVLLKLAM